MKKYFFDDYRGRNWLTLKRGSAEWINADVPIIMNKDGSEFFGLHGLNGWFISEEAYNQPEKILKFVYLSEQAFYKKYNYPIEEQRFNSFKGLKKELEFIGRGY